MKIIAYTTLDRSRLMIAEKRDQTASASVANRYVIPLVEAAEARAAVAELIEAAKFVRENAASDSPEMWERLDVAIAHVQGSSE